MDNVSIALTNVEARMAAVAPLDNADVCIAAAALLTVYRERIGSPETRRASAHCLAGEVLGTGVAKRALK